MKKVRVLLAEDHAIVAEGLQSLLEDEVELVATVGDGRAMMETAKRLRPDVIVADISMPLLNGLDAARQLKTLGIPARVIFLTMHAAIPVVQEAFRAGASGYILKQAAAKELVEAVKAVAAGDRYGCRLITDDATNFLMDAARKPRPETMTLTPRKREVLQLIAEGRTMKEVAAILDISSRTAESHKYELMETLGVHTTAELVQHAMKLGVLLVSDAPPGNGTYAA